MTNDSVIILKEYIEALCYSKDITWTQTEILEAIANAIRETNLVIIVTNLPETDIQINKLYLVPSTNPRNTNLFDIFFYANGGWEQVDGLNFNIEDYYTKDEIDSILEDKANRNHNHADATISSSGFMSSSDKAKLNGISVGANKTIVDNNLSTISTNPVQNKIVKEALDTKADIVDLDDVAFSGSYNDLSNTPHIPDKVSELTNDSGYLTTHQSLANYYNKTEVDSSLNTKVDKVTGKQLSSNDYTTAEKNKVATIDNKADIVDLDDVAFSGSYNDLSNTPHIPDKVSELTNDSGYLTTHQSLDSKTVTIEKQSTPESGYSATYVVKQGGTVISPKINIPKDFLVKSGTVKTVTTANTPVNGYNVGEKYLDFVINAKDNSDSDEHLYINVKDLVDNYTADEVSLTLANKQFKIKDGGVSFAKLNSSLQSTINNKSDDGHTHSKSEITDFPSTMAPSSHSHGALSNAGVLNSDITSVNKIVVTDSSNNLKTISKLPADKVTHQDISNKIDTAGTGLSKSGTTINHSNSVTAQTSSALKKIKYDAQGHITGTDNVAKSDITSLGIPAQDTTYTHPSTHASTMITEASALSNIGTNANSTQHVVNEAINTKIGALATKESIDDIVAGDVDLTGYVKDTDSRLTDSRTPKSHSHGNISNDGVISGQVSKNVVTDSNGKITTENKPTIPSGNSTASNIKMNGTQSAGSLTTFAKADHVHPIDTSRAASSHTHTQSEITDLDKSKVSISRNLSSGTKVATITIDGTATDLYCNNDTNTTYSAVTQSANGLMTSADKQKLDKSMGISAGNIAGTTSVYTATLTGVTLTHGTLIVLYNAIGANAANATLNVNGLGAKPIYYNASAIPEGRFPNKATCLFMYNTSIVSTGCWQLIYSYDSNNTYTAASATPLGDSSSGAVGTSAKYAREDHVHPKSSIYAESGHTHTKSQITDFPTSMTPTSHTHGNITNDGVISNQASKNVVTDANGKITTEAKPTIPAGSSTATDIKMNGTQSAGTSAEFAKADHVHPIDTSRAAASHTHSNYLTSHQDISGKENITNKVTSMSSSSTDTQYPSAKAVYNGLNGKANSSHTHTKSQITDFPTSMTPTAHTDSNGAYGKATTNVWGHTKLSSATNSTDETMSATPKAVKTAYDLANGKSTVSFSQTKTSGIEIGKITINGTQTTLYQQDNDTTYTPSSAYPLPLDYNGKVGTSVKYAREDHAHPLFNFIDGGTSGTGGYVKTFQLKVTTTYQDVPIKVEFFQRGKTEPTNVFIKFTHANSTDPTLASITHTGSDVNVYLYKESTSTWSLIIQKSEGYDNIRLSIYNPNSGITITNLNTQISALPTSTTTNPLTKSTFIGFTSAEKTKLNGIATNANNYSHPSTHASTMITESTALGNIGTSANATQSAVNSGINTKLGNAVYKSSTTGLLKNDGTVMTSGTGASNFATGNHTHSNYLGSFSTHTWQVGSSYVKIKYNNDIVIVQFEVGVPANVIQAKKIKYSANQSFAGSDIFANIPNVPKPPFDIWTRNYGEANIYGGMSTDGSIICLCEDAAFTSAFSLKGVLWYPRF